MTIQELANEIRGNLSSLISAKVSIAFVKQEDGNVSIVYMDDGLNPFKEFIMNFSSENFKLLNKYDHSLPLSGTKLGFFKTSETSLIAIYSHGQGPVGQLLVFKSRIDLFSERIDSTLAEAKPISEVEDTEIKPLEDTLPPSAQRIPTIQDKYRKKKYTMEEATVIHNINGQRTIAEIARITEIPLLRVNEVIKKYEKKKYIKLKRIVSETIIPKKKSPVDLPVITPTSSVKEESQNIQHLGVKEEKAIPFVSESPTTESSTAESPTTVPFSVEVEEKKEIPPEVKEEIFKEALKKDLVHQSNEIFPIFNVTKSKTSKDDIFYLELCDGRHTINDIVELTKIDRNSLFKIFKKYQKKDGLKLLRFVGQESLEFEDIKTVPEVKEEKKPEKEEIPKEEPVKEEKVEEEDILESLSKDISELDLGDEELEEIALPKAEEVIEEAPIEIPEIEEELEITAESAEIDADLAALTTDLDLDDKVEDTISELSSLIEETETTDDEEVVVFEDALSELDLLIDEATEAVADVELIGIGEPSLPTEATSDTLSVDEKLKQYDESYEDPIPAEEAPIEPVFKNTVACGMCGTEFPASKRLCPSCKKPAMTCPNCGQPVAAIAKICPYCTNLISQ